MIFNSISGPEDIILSGTANDQDSHQLSLHFWQLSAILHCIKGSRGCTFLARKHGQNLQCTKGPEINLVVNQQFEVRV